MTQPSETFFPGDVVELKVAAGSTMTVEAIVNDSGEPKAACVWNNKAGGPFRQNFTTSKLRLVSRPTRPAAPAAPAAAAPAVDPAAYGGPLAGPFGDIPDMQMLPEPAPLPEPTHHAHQPHHTPHQVSHGDHAPPPDHSPSHHSDYSSPSPDPSPPDPGGGGFGGAGSSGEV